MPISPRNDLKVYRSCPEIRPHIRRVYGWFVLRWVVASPFFVVMLVIGGLAVIFEKLSQWLDFLGIFTAQIGDWCTDWMMDREKATIAEAHRVLSLEEIQARTPNLHLPRGRARILSKAEAAEDEKSGDDIMDEIMKDSD